MGYGTGTFDFLKRLGDKGLLRAGDRILELGAQEINNEVSPGTVLGFIERFNPSFDSPAKVEIDFGKAFLGTGWGLADSDGAGLNRSWRWIGSSGAASLFVHLIPSAEREMRTLIHDARPGQPERPVAACPPVASRQHTNLGLTLAVSAVSNFVPV